MSRFGYEYKIIQIMPAEPGWEAHYGGEEDGKPYLVTDEVVAWALCRVDRVTRDDRGNMVKTSRCRNEVHPLALSCVDAESPAGMLDLAIETGNYRGVARKGAKP